MVQAEEAGWILLESIVARELLKKKEHETSVSLYLADSLGINLQTRKKKKNLKELETIQIKMRSDNSTKPEHKN